MVDKTLEELRREPQNVRVRRARTDNISESDQPTTDGLFREKYDHAYGTDGKQKVIDRHGRERSYDPNSWYDREANKDLLEPEQEHVSRVQVLRSRNNRAFDDKKRQKQRKNYNKGRERAENFRADGVPIKGIARKLRAARAAYLTYWACGILYLVQVAFTIIAMVGFAIGSDFSVIDSVTSNSTVANAAKTALATNPITASTYFAGSALLSYFFSPEEIGGTIFVFGWIIASVAGIVQMAIATALFAGHRTNPFGENTPIYGFMLAAYFIMPPATLVPWGIFWIFSVIKNA